jgi:hypothetical protein
MENILAVKEMIPKYVELLMGKSPRHARHIILEAKKELGKSKKQKITIAEFCQLRGFNEDRVCKFLKIK